MKNENLLLFILIFPFIGSFIGLFLGRINEKYRNIFNVALTGSVFIVVTFLYKVVAKGPIEIYIEHIMGVGIHLKLDIFRYIFTWITCFVWFLVTLYSTKYLVNYKSRNRYCFFFILTFASTVGIFISENLLNLFTFFEIMSLTSYVLVIHDEDEYSHEAGETYLVMAISGGLVLLMGLFLLYDYTGTLEVSKLYAAAQNLGSIKYFISALIIIGFGVKAGMVPLHIWMPKAHPAAPAPASAILSGILVKTGIFGIMIVVNIMMAGDIPLSYTMLVIGFSNMVIGGFLAMFQRNVKRILAYSSMSQIGYILVGIGLVSLLKGKGDIAIYGTLYYIINHAIFKSLLFMIVGVIYVVLHELSINVIGGFGKHKKPLKILFIIGMFSIIGMPGFNGYTGKTLLHMALAEAHHMYGGIWFTIAEYAFTISSTFTVAYLLKIFIAIFVEKNDPFIEKMKMKYSIKMFLPMSVLAAASIYIGVMPHKVFDLISKAIEAFPMQKHTMEAHFYSVSHVGSALYIIGLGIGVYLLFVRLYLRKQDGERWWYKNYALNWISLEKNIYKPVGKVVFIICSVILKIIDVGLINMVTGLNNLCRYITLKEIKKTRGIKHKIKDSLIATIESSMAYFNDNKDKLQKTEQGIKESTTRINDILETKTTSLKEETYQLGEKMNSVNYSIFIFAGVLVISLFIMIK